MASCTGSVKIRGEGLWQFRECSKPTFANVLHIKQKRVFSFPGRSKQARKNQVQWCRIGVSWWDSRSENVLLWDQPILAQGPLGLVVCWLRLQVSQSAATWGKEQYRRYLSFIIHHFVPIAQCGQAVPVHMCEAKNENLEHLCPALS